MFSRVFCLFAVLAVLASPPALGAVGDPDAQPTAAKVTVTACWKGYRKLLWWPGLPGCFRFIKSV